jgi:hypothetical protein
VFRCAGGLLWNTGRLLWKTGRLFWKAGRQLQKIGSLLYIVRIILQKNGNDIYNAGSIF